MSSRDHRIAQRFPRIKCRFWLGVRARKASGLFNRHGDKEGLTVKRVFRFTPAYMAGFKRNDVLLSFGGNDLHRVRDLGRAVGYSKDQQATVQILRNGKPMTLTVTPQRWYLGRRMDFRRQYYSQGIHTARAPATPTAPVMVSAGDELPMTEEI